ncbi:Trafficking kinesin-binding protein 1 106 kDa O-GlcNAc transferase-interacting protein [Collichthys lucidus]|uniref:Trafficking kinesin-binding protein 1 106 kDa O-GlcNAc transferase-interacting protein n=1 Tax=Collichthys lucidus TaxID=240159 RepID=A0A4U5U6E9_COLLU|nr:Trafficking kinesin-binding protein 1 106 kDa O-GlcNAc transferase-interacting protein [Collichthys lucidus]
MMRDIIHAHLDSQSAFSLHEGRGEVSGALPVAPQPLHLASPGNLRDLGQEPRHDVSTLTDLCSDLPELEIVSLLSEGQPNYTLRADSVFGYDNDDWLHTPLLPPTVVLGLTHEQIEETLKYFLWSSSGSEEEEEENSTSSFVDEILVEEKKCHNSNNNNNNNKDSLGREVTEVLCSDRVGQVTKTYHDIKAVTHLLEEKERDLELAARIGQSLLKQNQELTARNEMLDEQLEIAKEEIAQLRHELTMRDDLLQFYASTEEIENAESHSPIKRNESCSSLSNFVQYDFLQQKLKGLEDENRKLRIEVCNTGKELIHAVIFMANDLTTETSHYEEQEQELMMVCVEELSSVNKQVVDLSEELARKVEDSLRQQEEISSLLAQIVDLQARCKGLTHENEELNHNLSASRESQLKLKSELKDLQDKYSQCEDMLCEAREDIKNLRNKSLPNSTVQRYTALASVLPMDSLAAEIEGTFRKGLDTPAPSEYKNHPWRVFETVKVVNKAVRLRSRCHSPGLPGSSPPVSTRSSCISTPRTSYYGSDNASLNLEDKPSPNNAQKEDNSGPKRLGQPGTPGGQDLEAALRSLSARQQNHSSERPFFDVERERKLHALAVDCEEGEGSSGFLTPNDSLTSSPAASTGTNYSNGSSRHSCGSSGGSRSYLPDRLQIVKPLEGSVTLHQWQQLAKPNLGGILHPRPGVLTKDFKELEVDIQHVYSLNDLEEDEPDLTHLSGAHSMVSLLFKECRYSRFPLFTLLFLCLDFCSLRPQRQKTSVEALSPALKGALWANLHSFGLPSCRNCELVSTSSPSQPHFGLGDRTTTTTTTNVTNSSLGLLQLLQEHGISASPLPHHNLHHSQSTKPAHPTEKDKGGGSSPDKVGRRNFFSLNLVEKLQSLGLHRVAAWGMKSRSNAERENKLHIV